MRSPICISLIPAIALPLVLVGSAVVPGSAVAQGGGRAAQQDSAIVEGVVQSQESGAAIAGAAVTLARIGVDDGASVIRAADESGRFRFAAIAPGSYLITVNIIGYREREDTVAVQGGTVTRLILKVAASPVPLDPLTAEVVRRLPWLSPDVDGFDGRRARLHGTFFDRAEIEARFPRVITDVLRMVPNTQVVGGVLHSLRTASISGRCPLSMFVDGVPIAGSLDTVTPPDMIEAIEVYTTLSQVPVQWGGRNPCGVVLIWLRKGAPRATPRDYRRLWKGVGVMAAFAGLLWVTAH